MQSDTVCDVKGQPVLDQRRIRPGLSIREVRTQKRDILLSVLNIKNTSRCRSRILRSRYDIGFEHQSPIPVVVEMLVRNVDLDIGIPDSQISQSDRVIHGIDRCSLGRRPLHDLREELCDLLILPDLESVCGGRQCYNAQRARMEVDACPDIVHFRSKRRDIRLYVRHDVALINIVPAVLVLRYPVDHC